MPMSFDEAREKAMEQLANEERDVENENQEGSIPPEQVEHQNDEDNSFVEEPAFGEVPATENVVEEQSENVNQAEIPEQVAVNNPQGNVTEQAIRAAEQATAQVQQMQTQMSHLQQQNESLQNLVNQMSMQHEEAAIDQAMQNKMPTLDFAALAFDDDETVREKQSEYARQMSEYVRNGIMEELAPYLKEAKEGIRAKEFESAIASMERVPELSKIRESLPQLEQIISNNPVISRSDASIEDKLIMAYAISRGVDSIQNPAKDPTAEELFKMYQENADLQRLVEKDRVNRAKSQPSVPPLSAGGGVGNAALNIPDKPKTLEDAKREAMKKYGR